MHRLDAYIIHTHTHMHAHTHTRRHTYIRFTFGAEICPPWHRSAMHSRQDLVLDSGFQQITPFQSELLAALYGYTSRGNSNCRFIEGELRRREAVFNGSYIKRAIKLSKIRYGRWSLIARWAYGSTIFVLPHLPPRAVASPTRTRHYE